MACILLLAYRIHAILLYFGLEHANVFYILKARRNLHMSFQYGFITREKLILNYLQDLYISSYIKKVVCLSRQTVFLFNLTYEPIHIII